MRARAFEADAALQVADVDGSWSQSSAIGSPPATDRPAEAISVRRSMSWSRRSWDRARPLVESWPVHGTSGYDFLNQVGGLFVDGDHVDAVSRIYQTSRGTRTRFSDLVYAKKLLIMQVSLASELHMLTHQLDRLAQKSRRSRDFTFNTLRYALREVIACFPVYRSYIDAAGASPTDRRDVEAAVRRARIRNPLVSGRVFRFIRDMLLGRLAGLRRRR